jgi:hypothetical protein
VNVNEEEGKLEETWGSITLSIYLGRELCNSLIFGREGIFIKDHIYKQISLVSYRIQALVASIIIA